MKEVVRERERERERKEREEKKEREKLGTWFEFLGSPNALQSSAHLQKVSGDNDRQPLRNFHRDLIFQPFNAETKTLGRN